MSSNQDKRENILYFLFENPGVSNKTISKKLQIALRTEQSVEKRFKDTGTIKRKSGSGRKKGFVRGELVKKVKDVLDRDPEISIRTLANKFKTSASTIQRVKRNCGYKSYKKKMFHVVKKSKKILQFVVQSCSIKNYVLKNLV